MAQQVAAQLPGYAYDAHRFFNADRAPAEAVSRRRAGLARLSGLFGDRYPRSLALSTQAAQGLSDLQFTGAYRVRFPFSPYLREQLRVASFVRESAGVMLTDLDGKVFYDLTGSYGVNVFGPSTSSASPKAAPARRHWARCWAVTTPAWPTTSIGCARSRGSTRSRST